MTAGLQPGAQGFEPGAAVYEQSRPSYPADAVACMVERLGIQPSSRIVDLAAGTGKFTRLLSGSLVAVEPVEGMRREFRAVVPGVPHAAHFAAPARVAALVREELEQRVG